ncbi:CPBP family intramembrane metalloprotease [Streptococcus sp. X16XC17]|uniref:CPBP family intramembrane glutamic endopeptidase n=1 Tax=unclassified Streptococcus TaxID=2608887 RepID=UPI00066FDD24|nr:MULTISPECIES: CPBP family intramembrane glutamic endopeptidase [unclassified Streptococcus]TCD46579.1 CPBP family intramembrane metalloprotease [Streptococcus sp. X16XC17]
MLKYIKGFGTLFLLFVLYYMSTGMVMSISQMTKLTNPVNAWIMCMTGFVLMGMIAYLYSILYKDKRLVVEQVSAKVLKFYWPIFIYIVLLVVQFLFPVGNSRNQHLLIELIQSYPLVAGIIVLIVAPIMEEWLFRGFFAKYLFPHIKGNGQLFLYMLVSGVLFSLVHGPTKLSHFLIYFTMGVSLAWLFMIKRDLRHSIALHAANNLLSFLMILSYKPTL